jgi:hypothetical protein
MIKVFFLRSNELKTNACRFIMSLEPSAEHPLMVSIREMTRNIEQNDLFHAECTDLAKTQDWPKGSGQMLDKEAWKRLLIAAWERAHKRSAQFYPALDGNGMDVVYTRSSNMTKAEMSDLIEYIKWWRAEISGPEAA